MSEPRVRPVPRRWHPLMRPCRCARCAEIIGWMDAESVVPPEPLCAACRGGR
jgi:hypothetical protein